MGKNLETLEQILNLFGDTLEKMRWGLYYGKERDYPTVRLEGFSTFGKMEIEARGNVRKKILNISKSAIEIPQWPKYVKQKVTEIIEEHPDLRKYSKDDLIVLSLRKYRTYHDGIYDFEDFDVQGYLLVKETMAILVDELVDMEDLDVNIRYGFVKDGLEVYLTHKNKASELTLKVERSPEIVGKEITIIQEYVKRAISKYHQNLEDLSKIEDIVKRIL